MRTIIAGSRGATLVQVCSAMAACSWTDRISLVVSGTASGADQYGEIWARACGLSVDRYPADWTKHGKAAGPIRNRLMAENADALVAVWDGKSRGTRNMIDEARKRGLVAFIYRTDGATDL